MTPPPSIAARRCLLPLLAVLQWASLSSGAHAARVTVITHGFNGNVTDWIIPLAEAIPGAVNFPGATFSCYEIEVQNVGGQYVAAATFLGGTSPVASDSGEIIIKLDWSTLAGIGGASSTTVANAAVNALLSPTFLPALGGRALAELPLHLIGHSRGGSVVTEMARFLGAQGVWVDQVTTLDPRPVGGFGDAGVATYANVLFADNYWQTLGDGLFVPNGQSVVGAYNRKLTSLSGGYSSSHSDVHLWYHGTVDLATPMTDTQASIGATQRSAWWTTAEAAGAATGFRFSLIGGGDRLSNAEPGGVGNGRIRDGFNKAWDLGAGVAANRTALASNSGLWPNVIRFVRANADPVTIGAPFAATFYQQSGAGGLGNVELRVFLDTNSNPYDGDSGMIDVRVQPTTGTNAVAASTLALSVPVGLVPPGSYALGVRISDGTRTRYLYLPERMQLTAPLPPPRVEAGSLTWTDARTLRFDVIASPGQTVAVLATTDFVQWTQMGSQTFTSGVWTFVDSLAGDFDRRFYRAVLTPPP